MQNSYVIASLAKALMKTSECIELMVNNTNEAEQQTPALSETYQDLILDELAHAQIIVLSLTKLLAGGTEQTDGEGSVFAPGELDDKKKDQQPE